MDRSFQPKFPCLTCVVSSVGLSERWPAQAITAAHHYADEVAAVDINPRAIRFVRFNAMINGLATRVRRQRQRESLSLDLSRSLALSLDTPTQWGPQKRCTVSAGSHQCPTAVLRTPLMQQPTHEP